MKPICFKCHRFYRMKKAGYYFIEGMPAVTGAQPRVANAASWRPYKIWVGDLWECKGCGNEILAGFGSGPISEHYHPDFAQKTEETDAAKFTVYDC